MGRWRGGSVVPCMVLVVFSFSCYILSPSILLLIAIFDSFIRLQVVDPRLSYNTLTTAKKTKQQQSLTLLSAAVVVLMCLPLRDWAGMDERARFCVYLYRLLC